METIHQSSLRFQRGEYAKGPESNKGVLVLHIH